MLEKSWLSFLGKEVFKNKALSMKLYVGYPKWILDKKALEEYYNTIRGKVKIELYKMINPIVQLSSDVAVLIYDYEAHRDNQVFRMHCTEVYKSVTPGQWKITHTHWSFVPSTQ